VVTDFGETAELAVAVLALPDGRIVAAGQTHPRGTQNEANFALALYRADGSLDPTFDGDGKVVTDFGGLEILFDADVGSDGKIVAVGYTGGTAGQAQRIAVARYKPDGGLDATFDGDGRVVTDLPTSDEIATAVEVQPDRKIIVASLGRAGLRFSLEIVRYTRRGRLDPSFAGDGIAAVGFDAVATSAQLAVQQNGKIVALGAVPGPPYGEPVAFALERFLPNGDVDPTFGTGGVATADIGAVDVPEAATIQPDGKIVAAGSTAPTLGRSDGDVALARFLPGTCSVPSIRGRTVAAARSLLHAGNCRLGRIQRAFSRRATRGRIISQSLLAGRDARDWALVAVVVSKGARR
jgi:uncharacterized delta-60 repeat protein